jgi:hypothetical protein
LERYCLSVQSLQNTLKRWRLRKTKLLSAAKQLEIKKQERFKKNAACSPQVVDESIINSSPSSPSPLQTLLTENHPDLNEREDLGNEFDQIDLRSEAERMAPAPPCWEESAPIPIPVPPPLVGETEELDLRNDGLNENEPELLVPSTGPGHLKHDIVQRWEDLVFDLKTEYITISEQTLEEFDRFMKNKQSLLAETMLNYATQQVFFVCS